MALKEEDIERAWRTVFKTPEGRLVLTDLMVYLGRFRQQPQTHDAVAKSNIAFWILTKMGVYKKENQTRIINTYIDWVE